MFDSRSKKQPTLVFAHKSQQSAVKNVGHEVTKIPRVALVGGAGNDPSAAHIIGQQQKQQQQQTIEHPPKVERQSLQRQGPQMNSDLQNTQRAQDWQRMNQEQSVNVETILQGLELKERNGAKVDVKAVDGEGQAGAAKSSGQSGGQQNILYKDVAYAVVKSAATEENNSFGGPRVEQYEGYSIYREPREVATSQAPAVEGPSKPLASAQTTTSEEVTVISAVMNSSSVSSRNDDENVLMRHPNSASDTSSNNNNANTSAAAAAFRTVAPSGHQHPYQTVQRQHQQYQRTHQILQAQQQSAIAEHSRQAQMTGHAGHASHRVQSYPQSAHQVVAKSIRLVGPSPHVDVAYTPVKVRVAAAPVKQRPHSYSATPNKASWQVAVPVKYAIMGHDGNVYMVKHGSGVSPRLAHREVQEVNTLPNKPPTPNNNNNNVRPKSILKNQNQTQPEAAAPEWHQNARAIHIPRAQSLKNPPSAPVQTYDFSNILTANSDTVSYVRSTSAGSHADPAARPVSADATQQTIDGAEPGTPQKKSVKFNTQVRLHTDDHVSNVITLAT